MRSRTAAASRSWGSSLRASANFLRTWARHPARTIPGEPILFVTLVGIALEDAPVTAKERSGAFPRPAHAEVKDHRSSGPAVLELVGLVIAALGLLALHADRGFIGLDASAFERSEEQPSELQSQ